MEDDRFFVITFNPLFIEAQNKDGDGKYLVKPLSILFSLRLLFNEDEAILLLSFQSSFH